MIYEFISKTGKIIEIEKSMTEDIPQTIEKDGKIYIRKYGNNAVHIPFQWNEHTGRNKKYGKRPSAKKILH